MIKLNGKEINVTMFPDRTSQVWQISNLNTNDQPNVIVWDYESEAELFHVVQLESLVQKMAVDNIPSILVVPYLPFARQDKEVSNETSFALKIFADIINAAGFDEVVAYDVHSNEAKKLINRFCNIIPDFSFAKNYDLVVFGDESAKRKYQGRMSPFNIQHMWGEKVRDQKTGWITHYELKGNYQPTDLSVLVVDDLCDGGATFEILGESLRRLDPQRLDLYVSHGIFSKGVHNLLRIYDKIVTTDTRFYGINLETAKRQSRTWGDVYRSLKNKTLEIKPVLKEMR